MEGIVLLRGGENSGVNSEVKVLMEVTKVMEVTIIYIKCTITNN